MSTNIVLYTKPVFMTDLENIRLKKTDENRNW